MTAAFVLWFANEVGTAAAEELAQAVAGWIREHLRRLSPRGTVRVIYGPDDSSWPRYQSLRTAKTSRRNYLSQGFSISRSIRLAPPGASDSPRYSNHKYLGGMWGSSRGYLSPSPSVHALGLTARSWTDQLGVDNNRREGMVMKRTVLTVALCVGVLGVGLATSASATDPFKALDRRVNRLESRVNGLERQIDRVQGQLLRFEDFFFACVVPNAAAPPVAITGPDGLATTGVPLYADTLCLGGTAKPQALRRAYASFKPSG
jgi:hypothetical protein